MSLCVAKNLNPDGMVEQQCSLKPISRPVPMNMYPLELNTQAEGRRCGPAFSCRAYNCGLVSIVQTIDIINLVPGDKRPELELYILVGRKFQFELRFTSQVLSASLAHAGLSIDRKLLFAFQSYARAFRESENVFCFYLAAAGS
jgi:hypothetical protein